MAEFEMPAHLREFTAHDMGRIYAAPYGNAIIFSLSLTSKETRYSADAKSCMEYAHHFARLAAWLKGKEKANG